MTPSEQKQLAEKVAKWLGCAKLIFEDVEALGLDTRRSHWDLITGPALSALPYHTCRDSELVDVFFNQEGTASILMHLGKREMEKRDFWWEADGGVGDYGYCISSGADGKVVADERHENEFYAFWLAVEQTGEMG